MNGKLVPGYGGGICQVSSTLFNALLQCDAKIIERSPHSGYSETTAYVNLGRDAAVSFGYKDLKFSFPQQRTILFTYVEGDRLIAEIWGEKEFRDTKSITSQIRNITENGKDDVLIDVETIIFINDKIEKRYQDRYVVSNDFAQFLKKQYKNQ